jgi:hypothetical protein
MTDKKCERNAEIGLFVQALGNNGSIEIVVDIFIKKHNEKLFIKDIFPEAS